MSESIKNWRSGSIEYLCKFLSAKPHLATELSRIDLPQADLGDLLIAATASVFDLTLVTSDHQLLQCPWLKTLANG